MAKVAERTMALAEPIVAGQGCTVWDVEYVKEAGTGFLRVYIDKPGGVDLNDCEAISRALSDSLDEADPIEGSYTLEISSAGIDRVLKTPEHFAQFLGSEVELKLYRPVDGRKDHVGVLASYTDGDVMLQTAADSHLFPKKEIAQVRLYVKI